MTEQLTRVFTVFYSSPIGLMEISGTEEVVHSIMFRDEEFDVEGDVPDVLNQCVTQLKEYFAGTRREFNFPVEQSGTDFQQNIWHRLHNIAYGKTNTYLKLSGEYGNPKAIRAVGAAVGKNKLTIVVPCHRVVGSNGQLVGFSGGLWRKEWLLKHEEKIAYGTKELFD